ncbi:DUF2206 domain-containing protein [Paractinoplanes globisporus]|uniref:DUF2206 domain-containing protein n=1 Tax=Paractinoplanes globisporus TaxID=113565 RepID=A0ABW6WEP2_9ACTN|nr:DUF2206 domain-containing protein [Actinoplanes globisporus]
MEVATAGPMMGRIARLAAMPLIVLLVVNALVLLPALSPLRGPVTLAVALVMPGALALRTLRITTPDGWTWLLYAVALSIAGLQATAAVICLAGVRLGTVSCLVGLDALVVLLAAAGVGVPPVHSWRKRVRVTPIAVLGVTAGAGAVACAIIGAGRLNAGAGNTTAATGLALAAACLAVAAAGARRNPAAAATAVYLLALAVLFATSLRGAAVTGHDIKLEYRVFTDVLDSGRWQSHSMFVGYNSCLSITLLPTILARVSGIAALDVFRVCFQMLFAIVPVGVFLVARRFIRPPYAVLAAGLFVAFPAFVNDMPMLNRQEIALIFFTVLILLVTRARQEVSALRLPYAVLLVALLGGLAVSHYSTAYVAVALLVGAWLVRLLRRPVWRGVPALHTVLGGCGAALLALTISWASVTGSASELGGNLATAWNAVTGQLRAGTNPALVPAAEQPGSSDQVVLDSYLVRRGVSASVPAGCAPATRPPDKLAVKPLGAILGRAGLPPSDFNAGLRAGAVAVFEAGAGLGVLVLLLREWRHRGRRLRAPTPMADLAVTAMVLLALPVLSPSLSGSYGPLRLYQQLLIVLAPAVVVGLCALFPGARLARTRGALAGLIVGACLLSTSGLVPEVTGGYPPQLNLNNAGIAYDAFYADENDRRMASWIRDHLSDGTPILADGHDSLDVRAMTRLNPMGELFPGSVPDVSRLLLRTSDGRTVSALITLPDRTVRYRIPVRCVAAGRSLMHVAGPLRLYGPRLS